MALTRLAVYGTLAPGKANHHQLAGLTGTWIEGWVRGRLAPASRGEHTGLPGLVLDEGAEVVAVRVFTSRDLPAHWARLDAFEGSVFPRFTVAVATDTGPVLAQIYVLEDEVAR